MIRLAHADDLQHLAGVERSAATRFAGTPLAWAMQSTLPAGILRTALARHLLWVAVDDVDLPIGFAAVCPAPDALFVDELSVARPHQGRGFGRALLDAVIEEARARKLSAVILTTDRHLAWNAPFYGRYGFTLLAEEELTPYLRQRIDTEVSHGHERARRCAMRFAVAT